MSSIRDAFAVWLTGGGEMGDRIRAHDWRLSPIGRPETWSPALRNTLRVMLANRFPHILWWGSEHIQFYNDAYIPVPGNKHPELAFARPGRECWSEIWHIIGPLVATPFEGGPATWNEDILLEVHRRGYLEETHFTIAYSPVPDDTAPNGIGGVLGTIHEITEKVIGERRVAALRDLANSAFEAKTVEEACKRAIATLSKYDRSVPFALAYLIGGGGKQAHFICGADGISDEAFRPAIVDLEASDQAWPLGDALRSDGMVVVGDLASRFGAAVPKGPWSEPPREAVIVPIRSNIAHQPLGVLVLGVSARSKLDLQYKTFFEFIANHFATAIGNARALEEERKRAEALAEIDRAKTLFFSNISHEFRTPLTLMLGPLEDALASQDLQGKDRESLTAAHRNSLRLLKLVNTLMDFSRVEAGRFQAVFHPTDLSAFTADLASTFRSACERAGLRLVVRCAPLPEPVYLDREMWEKIVLNLLSNAFKFTFAGEIEVNCRADGSHVEVSVRDTGTGIPEHELPRIFERFHRVENAKGRTHEGTGIGLALVKELVKLQGGGIDVSSVCGKGAVFTIRIPFGTAHLPPDRVSAARTQASTATQAEAYIEEALHWLPEPAPTEAGGEATSESPFHGEHRPRVLVADDNADMRAYLRSILSARYDVDIAADGVAAFETVQANRPALAVLDVMMPRMDGFAVLRALREHSSLKDLPVILLSARAGEEAETEGLAAGADDYIVKPFSARELLARVQANINLATLRNEAAATLRASEERLKRVLETDAVGVLFWDRERCLADANDVFLRMTGYTREDVRSGKLHWRTLTAPEHISASEAQQEAFAKTGRVGPYEKEYFRKDGSRAWMLFAGRDLGDGSLVEFAIDIADRKRAEAALRESESRLTRELMDTKRLQNFSSMLIEKGNVERHYEHIVDAAMAIMRADFGSIQMLDEEHSELRLLAWRNFHPDSAEFWRTVSVKAGSTCGAALQHGERIVVPDVRAAPLLQGSESQKYWALSGIVAVQSTPLTTREGRVIGMISTHWREVHLPDDRELRLFDILARQAADYFERARAEAALHENEQRLHLLLREVNHRAKNMLSLVQAVARQTAAASPQDFLARFAERIQALATSQDLLVNAEWKGVDLVELVRLQLAHFQDLIGARIELKGPPLLISPSAAQTLGMTIHELATNAGKYGALSVAEGRIAIAWEIERRDGDGEVFTMSWRERGGPPVAAPSRNGFGSTVIGRLTESSLNAKVDLEYAETGLSWRLQCPSAGVVEGKLSPPKAETRSERDASNGSRPKVLVVEDEALVAMEIAHVLKDADFEVLGPARAVIPALSLLEECGCDAAVLDINLGGETSEAIARKLLANGTRFITLSGYSRTQHPPIFADVPALAKPLRPALLIEEIKRCLAAKENLPTA